MAVRESAVHKNHTIYIYWVISLNHLFFDNDCLSGPYLGKHNTDWN